MMEVILRIKMPDNWVKEVSSNFPLSIRFIDCKPFGEDGGRGLIEIDSTDIKVNDVIEEIQNHPGVCSLDITRFKDGSILGTVVTAKCVACKMLTGSECFLTSAMSVGDGFVEWQLITGSEGSLADLIDKLQTVGCEIELKSTKNLSKKLMLTQRQGEIVQAAFEMGYYDHPKKITIKDIAECYSISTSTLAEILQRGERKIISEHFRDTLSFST